MIKVHLFKSSKDKYDITNVIKSVAWSGDVNTLPRKIEISLKNLNDKKRYENLINYFPGNMIVVYKDKQELFRGFVFRRSIDTNGDDSLTAYDELIYATKNMVSLVVKNKSASDIIISLFKKYGVNIGKIESTGYKIKKMVFQNQAMSEVIQELLDETWRQTGKRYFLYSKQGKVYLTTRAKAMKYTIKIDDIISGSREVSIEELKTRVMVTKGSLEGEKGQPKYKTYTAYDKNAESKYGIMQHTESIDDKATLSQMKKKAQSLLKQLNRPKETIKVDFIGDVNCITGNVIEIHDEVTDVIGKYYITSDTHTFSEGTYKMSLQLSTQLE
jgi:hypothetical protein